MQKLIQKIQSKKARIGVIGLGYVGLPLVIRFCQEGFTVIGFDVDPAKVAAINAGRSYIQHIAGEQLEIFVRKRMLKATADFKNLRLADAIIICVPTPLNEMREPDLQYVEKTGDMIARYLRPGQIVSLESTTYPGTTDEVLLPKLVGRKLKAGRDFFLVFSPEREDPGNKSFSTQTIPKVVGGLTPACRKVGEALYAQIIDTVVSVSSTRAAELTKLLENIYRCVNIALVNELKMLADRMGIDIWEVIHASSTKPFGFAPFYPGPGLGGHCIPIDPFYLSWKARAYDFTTKFIELAGEVNTSMPYYVVNKIIEALNAQGKSLKGSQVLVLGIAYKKDIDDDRESPSLKLIEILQGKGAAVLYNDPYVPRLKKARKYAFSLSSVALTERLLKKVDVVLIATDHSCYDYDWIARHAQLVVDSRNAVKNKKRFAGKIVGA
jgi:UDP-N-acetyl-D-glucosamine dehydrogenase